MVKLKEVRLEGIAKKEYDDMHIWWEGHIWMGDEGDVYSKVTNPICFEVDDTNRESRAKSYHSAVLELLKNQCISCLSVNNRGKWIRANKSEEGKYQLFGFIAEKNEKPSIDTKLNDINQIDSDPEIFKIAEIAAMDKFHHAYMEVRIGYEHYPKNRAWIGFVEYETQDGKRIIGYYVNLHYKHRVFFNVENEMRKWYKWNHGLWVPEDYKDLPSPVEERKKGVYNQKNI